MSYDVSLLLDGLILVFLCVTIFYAARLSLFMKSFREGRSDMQRLIHDLSAIIDKAETSINMMKGNAAETETEIRNIINEAKFLSDELRFMNETGDNLANRLEKLADRNRELVDLIERSGGIGAQRVTSYEPSNPADVSKQKNPDQFEDDQFDIEDFDLDSGLDDDDEFDFRALGDGAYREDDAHDFTDQMVEQESDSYEPRVNTQAKSKVRSFAIFDREFNHEDVEEDGLNDEVGAFESSDGRRFHSRAEQDLYEALQRKKRDFDEEPPPSKHVSKIS